MQATFVFLPFTFLPFYFFYYLCSRLGRNNSFLNKTIMVNYKDLGLVNTREMFKRAVAGGCATWLRVL